MNNKDYLDKIASENRPLTAKAPGFLGNKLNLTMTQIKIIGGVAGAILLVFIVAMIATSGDKNPELKYVDQAYLRAEGLTNVIEDNRKLIRSSKLRSMAMSLNAVLTELSYILANSIVEDFGAKSVSDINKKPIAAKEEEAMGELADTLEAARLNAVLDRVFAREFTYQISLLISMETDIINHTKKEPLKTNIESSRTNLETIHEEFDSFAAN